MSWLDRKRPAKKFSHKDTRFVGVRPLTDDEWLTIARASYDQYQAFRDLIELQRIFDEMPPNSQCGVWLPPIDGGLL